MTKTSKKKVEKDSTKNTKKSNKKTCKNNNNKCNKEDNKLDIKVYEHPAHFSVNFINKLRKIKTNKEKILSICRYKGVPRKNSPKIEIKYNFE
jgi:hypothetical protein